MKYVDDYIYIRKFSVLPDGIFRIRTWAKNGLKCGDLNVFTIYRGSYMSDYVLLIILKEVREKR